MGKYNEILNEIKAKVPIGESFDLLQRDLNIGGRDAKMFFVDGLVDGAMMQRVIFSLFALKKEDVDKANDMEAFLKYNLPFLDAQIVKDVEKGIKYLYSGLVPLIIDGYDYIIIIDCRDYPLRSIEEPSKEKSLRGAKDGFVESMMKNIALIRRRIRDNDLIFKSYAIGDMTRTDVSMVYMRGKADESMVNNLDKRLKNMNPVALTITEQSVVELLTEKKSKFFNAFPKVRYTQRPDIIAAHVEEGKIAIIVDNSPTVILIPIGIFDFTQEIDDFYFPVLTGNYFRFLRFLNVLIILFATPVFLLFAEGKVPVVMGLEFFVPREEYAISIFWQFILLELAIDGLKLASLNTPDSLGMSLSVIGALILGDFSVSSGWFIPQTILCMAVVALAAFTQPSMELGYAIKFVRIFMLIGAHIFGIWGIAIAFIVSVIIMASTKTVMGTSYLYPLIPWDGTALKKFMFRTKTHKRN